MGDIVCHPEKILCCDAVCCEKAKFWRYLCSAVTRGEMLLLVFKMSFSDQLCVHFSSFSNDSLSRLIKETSLNPGEQDQQTEHSCVPYKLKSHQLDLAIIRFLLNCLCFISLFFGITTCGVKAGDNHYSPAVPECFLCLKFSGISFCWWKQTSLYAATFPWCIMLCSCHSLLSAFMPICSSCALLCKEVDGASDLCVVKWSKSVFAVFHSSSKHIVPWNKTLL